MTTEERLARLIVAIEEALIVLKSGRVDRARRMIESALRDDKWEDDGPRAA